MLSVIIPAYNEEKIILKTGSVIGQILGSHGIDYELIFVNDGSSDSTWEKIKELSHNSYKVVGINFSKNFGKEAAILAGLGQAAGDCCAVIDCDLQHPPEVLIKMYEKWQKGYEVVEGVKTSRGKESKLHRLCANWFYTIITKITKLDLKNASDFRLLDRKVVNALLTLPEKHFFFRALSSWVGYKHTTVEFNVKEREEGESKWSTSGLIKYAIYNITSFTAIPLQLMTVTGGICWAISIILMIQIIFHFFLGHVIKEYIVLMLLLLLVGGTIMVGLGAIGHYVALIYDEVKNRPRFILKEICRGETCHDFKN